jgi:2-polyprenyl-3-methyl-5-hydroxy-6-metoxy-1,4-benzoquinol methylase
MNETLKNRINESANFYKSQMLDIDYKQTTFCYNSFKDFFVGEACCELGPSTGYMTKLLINDFKKIHVVEGALELLKQIPENEKLVKHHSLFEDFEPPIQFDTIIMNHVLEHIQDPVSLLKKLKTWISPGGVLIIGVPNAKSFHRLAAVKMGLLSSEYELNDRDKQLGHYRVYDLETLSSDAKISGWSVEKSGGVFLKFLSNSQINNFMTEEMIEAYYLLGKDFPINGAEIFIIAKS